MPNHAAHRPAAARPQRGSTLIEVLVTVVILAFSLLGLAGLLNQTTSMAQESHRRTVVTQNIYALADRMRVAIAAGVNANDYNSLSGTPSPAACSTTATAQVDFCEWTQTLKTSLGADATGKINRVGSTNLFTIEVDWKDPKVVDIHDVPITQTYSLTVRP